jgi:hypothetical protein
MLIFNENKVISLFYTNYRYRYRYIAFYRYFCCLNICFWLPFSFPFSSFLDLLDPDPHSDCGSGSRWPSNADPKLSRIRNTAC